MIFSAKWTGKAVSSNRRLRNGRTRMYPDPDYAAFKRSLALTFAAARITSGWQTTREDVCVNIMAHLPARMDGEAVQKPILDALELGGVVANDHQCVDVRMKREGTADPSRIEVTVQPLATIADIVV